MFHYSVILTNVGSCSDRYMTCGYGKRYGLRELFERVASVGGVEGVELIGGVNLQNSDESIAQVGDLLKEYALKPVAVIPDHFGRPEWGRGAFTSPEAAVRAAAVREGIAMAEAARAVGCPLVNIWNGQDGYDYPMQVDYIRSADQLAEGLRELAGAAPDIRFALEYKPKEPRCRSFIPSVWAALCCAAESGCENLGVTVDVGHAFEAGENAAEAVCNAMARHKLFHLHINDNNRLWDDDMICGSVHTVEYIELFYWLRRLGYEGFISVDQYPYREESRDAAEQSIRWMQAFERAASRLEDREMDEIFTRHDAVAASSRLRSLLFD